MFIRQSIRSDYCAVYATGMALSLAGFETSRQRALSLFRAGRGWQGAAHTDIDAAINRATGREGLAWCSTFGALDGRNTLLWLGRQAKLAGGPIIVTASCRLVRHNVVCGHAFLVVGCEEGRLQLLDPLTREPKAGERHNLEMTDAGCSDLTVRAVGCLWEMLTKQPVYCKEVTPRIGYVNGG